MLGFTLALCFCVLQIAVVHVPVPPCICDVELHYSTPLVESRTEGGTLHPSTHICHGRIREVPCTSQQESQGGQNTSLHSASAIVVMLTSPCCKVDLMKNFKRSTARDFKINTATVTARLAEEMEDDVRSHTHAAPPPHTPTHTLPQSCVHHGTIFAGY